MFTANSKAGAEALASAEAAGAALETAGRRVNFGCGMLLVIGIGLFVGPNLWTGVDPQLHAMRLAVYLTLVLVMAVAVGAATAKWGTRAWKWLHETWLYLS